MAPLKSIPAVLIFFSLFSAALAQTSDHDSTDVSLAASLSNAKPSSKLSNEASDMLAKEISEFPDEALSLLQTSAGWSERHSSPVKKLVASGAIPALLSEGATRLQTLLAEPGAMEFLLFLMLIPVAANASKKPRQKKKEGQQKEQQGVRRNRAPSAPARPRGTADVAKWKEPIGGVSPSNETNRDYNKLIGSCVMQAFEPQKPRCELGQAIHKAAKKGDIEAAAKALTQLEEGGGACLSDYNAVISVCAKGNDPEGAHKWLQRVSEMGLEANSVCYNAVINAHAKRGELQKAVEVAVDMRNKGVGLDTVSYNTIIDACARAGDADSAEQWMREMLDAGVKASVVSFGSIMLACARASNSDKVELWLQEADRLGIEVNMICFSAVINAFAKANDLDNAAAWIKRMMERGVKPTIHCFTGMIESALKNHDINMAAKLVEDMRTAGVEPDAAMFNWLVTACGRCGDEDQARAWASEAADGGFFLNRKARRVFGNPADGNSPQELPRSPIHQRDLAAARLSAAKLPVHAPEDAVDGDSEEARALVGRVFNGTIKEYITAKFGYIVCDETYAVFRRDVFLSSNDNPQGYAKGQRVSFKLFLDKKRNLPRAADVQAYTCN